ncbi:hypothetical protein TSAR_003403 [Trichomalopsis sarcophagae]|uniref:Uncharacterized protein n=1 Tax=Trichomalopsis sarcophagae TaxID=543379 RepID=A0A232FII3_9HYME|nr:hypothetical protein TSAR_003403 [Trichomalopsis sarcophagae]
MFGGKTQNANESFNNVLWNIAPKTDFIGLEILQISTFLACIMFSSVWKGLLYLMSELNIKPGKNALFAAVTKDQARIKNAEKQAECNTKEARKLRILRISTVDDGAYVSSGH